MMPAANQQHQAFNGAARDIALSNNTSQLFLGGRRLPWMTAQDGHHAPTQPASSIPRPATTNRPAVSEPLQTVVPSQLLQTSGVSSQQTLPHNQTISFSQALPATPSDTDQAAPTTIEPNTRDNGQLHTGLPNGHNEGTNEAPGAQSPVTGNGSQRVTEQLRKRSMDTTTAEFNKRLRVNSTIPSPSMIPSLVSPSPLTRAPSRPPSATSQGTGPHLHRQPSISALDGHVASAILSPAAVSPPVSTQQQQFSVPSDFSQATTMQPPDFYNYQTPQNVPSVPSQHSAGHVDLPDKRALDAFDAQIEHFRASRQDLQNMPGPFTWRVEMLRSAMRSRDYFFLFLHQIYCLSSTDPTLLGQIASQPADALRGIKRLEEMLLSNRELPPPVLLFFSKFPADLSRQLHQMPVQSQQIAGHVCNFLSIFGTGWEEKRKVCLIRGCPPWPEEVAEWFGTISVSVQRILWTAIHRQLDGHDAAIWTPGCRKLFSDAQAVFANARFGQQPGRSLERTSMRTQAYQNHRHQGIFATRNPNSNPTVARKNSGRQFRGAERSSSLFSSYGTGDPQISLPGQGVQAYNHMVQQNQSSVASQSTMLHSLNVSSQNPHISRTAGYPSTRVLSPRQIQQQRLPTVPQMIMPSNQINSVPQQRIANQSLPNDAGTLVARNGVGSTDGQKFPLFYPPAGFELPQSTAPKALVTAIHQVRLNSPIARKMDHRGVEGSDIRLYQYLKSFIMTPVPLGSIGSLYTWKITIPPAYARNKAALASSATLTESRKRWYIDGSYVFRLRCIAISSNDDSIRSEHIWSARDNVWPSSVFISLNGHDLEPRRKLHYLRDLPLDLTDYVTEQENTIVLSLVRHSNEAKKKLYAVAVEVVEIGDEQRVLASIKTIPKAQSLGAITTTLMGSKDDDDLVLVDPHLSIDLVDPFMATMFKIPVRGLYCLHRECFDLDTFLHTRKSQTPGNPTSADEWKCPICKRDARPQSLVIDGFLQEVREELERRSALETRAILVKADGTWEVKKETNDENKRGGSTARRSESVPDGSSSMGSVLAANIIELDDDDD